VNPASTLPAAGDTPAASLAKGFTYIINNANFPGGVQAVLRLLDTYGNTKVVANPHIAALDNQKATIKAGNRIPISQQTLVGGTTNAVTTTSQYIDTGVLLQVTPHINAGGLVSLDVQAEVSNPGNPAQTGDAPPINTRSVQTYVAVQSGQTMVMGGLIGDTRTNASEGIPLLSRIPIIGGLFGNQKLKNDRTELVLFITPRVVENEVDLRGAIDDLRRRMDNLDAIIPLMKPILGPVFPYTPANPNVPPILITPPYTNPALPPRP
jgi:general secretion pathway protein D